MKNTYDIRGSKKASKLEVLPHPPNNPDIFPCDCYLLLSILRNKQFNSKDEVKIEVDQFNSKNPAPKYC